tara:strand:- start:299 stop:520 length:222 start_codon:yes stop_codon:yes gene_type:complete
MATTKPVERIINVSIEVNANINGVNITPPPTPAMTEIIATKTLKRNESNMRSIADKTENVLSWLGVIKSSRKA